MIAVVMVLFLVAMMLFGYLRNRQADRNDARRERLWDKEEELMKLLQKKDQENKEQSKDE